MGRGTKTTPAQETSRKGKISERVADGAGGAMQVAPDPCTEPRTVEIDLKGAPVAVGDSIWLIPGSPPHAVASSGIIGPIRGASVKRLEGCIGAGYRFEGVINAVATSRATALVRGA